MLPEEVKKRLDLLLDSRQIQPDIYDKVRKNLNRLIREGSIHPDSDSIGPFTSHLAIAVERIKNGKAITETNKQVEELVTDNPDLYRQSDRLLQRCLGQTEHSATKAEIGFITLYMTLVRKNRM
ncbi:PRD domain-containing protein [Paludifilum halophilum]|uniref:PRD domain-containing protein n=1 Tax=Paludifilum halophilum TaxID=1642702 RepID=A0A235B3D5_9BACL|nr:PRD domain-containing protein [Paludifilum halophilum]OYD06810.1 hypothetical protein CHM34_14755 [Paludifilum halophilum]